MSGLSATCLSHDAIKYLLGPQPTTIRGQGLHLTRHTKLSKIIYASGKHVVVRDIKTPTDFFVYRGHNATVTVAKFSPNGYWVASGDVTGKVRVWSWDNPEHILKLETTVFGGEVKDIDWDPDSKRIIAVGDGREANAKVFMWDSGNSVGEMNGHGKRVLSATYRPCRPFRIMTASEDNRTVFYTGPPFAMEHSNTEHTNFVNDVRYFPDGKEIISVGSDKKVVLYSGQSGRAESELPEAHTGSIYSVACSADNKIFATASADKTVTMWSRNEREALYTARFAVSELGNMQMGVAWVDQLLVSVSLNGDLNILEQGAAPRALQGHQGALTAMAVCPETQRFFTTSYDGVVIAWTQDGVGTRVLGRLPGTVNGAAHSGKVSGAIVSAGELKTVGFDDKLRCAGLSNLTYTGPEVELDGQPVAIANGSSSSAMAILVTRPASLLAYRGREQVAQIKLTFTPSALAVLGEEEVAIGGEDMKVHIYGLTADVFGDGKILDGARGQISALAYSPSGDFLAVGDSNRQISVYERQKWTPRIQGEWVHHTSRITSLAWSSSGSMLASGSLDSHVILWNLQHIKQRIHLDFAHKDGVSALGWLSDTVLITAGNDAVIVVWDVDKVRKKLNS